METNEKAQQYKKIIERFLKETNLFYLWEEYINKYNAFIFKNYVYNVRFIDQVFGQLNFTGFLAKKDVFLPSYISDIFREYIDKIYGKKFAFDLDYRRTNIEIDKKSHRIKIIN